MMNGSQRLKRSHLLARGWMQATPKVGTRSNFFMILAAAFSTQVMATAWMEGPPPHHTQLQYISTFWSSSHAHNSYLASTDWKVLLTLHFRRKSNLHITLFNSFGRLPCPLSNSPAAQGWCGWELVVIRDDKPSFSFQATLNPFMI